MPPKRARGKDPSRTLGARVEEPSLDWVLDQLDAAVQAGDRERSNALVEQLYARRAGLPDVLVRRLIAGNEAFSAFAFELLEGTAAPTRLRSALQKIAKDTTAPDLVRWQAQQRRGWPERGAAKKRLAFLSTLRNADETLVAAMDQTNRSWPPDLDPIEEVLGYLEVLPSERALAVVRQLGERFGGGVAWLLHALLHVPQPALQQLAIDLVERANDSGALGPLDRLAQTDHDAAVRQRAVAAIERLSDVPDERRLPREPLALPALDRVYLSAIDGSGAQTAVIIRQAAEGVYGLTSFFWSDDVGVRDVLGQLRAPPEWIEELLGQYHAANVPLVEVDLAVARGMLAQAIEATAEREGRIPPAFELWEPFVHDAYPATDDETVIRPDLDDARYAARADLRKANGKLLDLPAFASWTFDLDATLEAMDRVPPPVGGQLTSKQDRPLLELLLTSEQRTLLRGRLRRQAWLLDRSGEVPARDRALATAAALERAPVADLAKEAFWKGMLERSVDLAVLGMAFADGQIALDDLLPEIDPI